MLKKIFIFVISFVLVTYTWAYGWSCASANCDFLAKGKSSAEEATRYQSERTNELPAFPATGFFSTEPDTAEVTFYEEERNLTKEIVVWVIGAAFVSYFIIKVFLEGDEEEEQEKKPQKEIPDGAANAPAWSWSF